MEGNMGIQTRFQMPWVNLAPLSVASAEAVSASGVVGSTVIAGNGAFNGVLTVSGYTGGSSFDAIRLVMEANTNDAQSTWSEMVGDIIIGDTLGRGSALTSVTGICWPMFNTGDYQVRLRAYLLGSAAAATITLDLYPKASRDL